MTREEIKKYERKKEAGAREIKKIAKKLYSEKQTKKDEKIV